MTGRFTARWSKANELFLQENIRVMDVHGNLGSGAKVLRYTLQSALLGIGAYLVVVEQASRGIMIASSVVMGRALARAPHYCNSGCVVQILQNLSRVLRMASPVPATTNPLPPEATAALARSPSSPA
jgi:ATP-binding cassette subfamily C protein PrsD